MSSAPLAIVPRPPPKRGVVAALRALWGRLVEGTSRRFVRTMRPMALPRRSEWYLADIPAANRDADAGNLRRLSELLEAAKTDGRIHGLLQTRYNGLFQLPSAVVSSIPGSAIAAECERELFRRWTRPERVRFASNLGAMGVAIAETVIGVDGRPQIVTHPNDFVTILPATGQILFHGEEVHGGDGRWIVGRLAEIAPHREGFLSAIGRAFIPKDHSVYLRENYQSTLANAARVATAPQGATEVEFDELEEQVAKWGPDTVLTMSPGYSVELLEGNGQGYQIFRMTAEDMNNDLTFAICGQTVTAEGTTGFVTSDMFQAIRGDVISGDAEIIASIIDTQVLPWIHREKAPLSHALETLQFKIDAEDPKVKSARLDAKAKALAIIERERALGYDTSETERDAGLIPVVKGAA